MIGRHKSSDFATYQDSLLRPIIVNTRFVRIILVVVIPTLPKWGGMDMRQPTDEERRMIERYLADDEDNLYFGLAYARLREEYPTSMFSLDIEATKRAGRKFWRGIDQSLQQKLCGEWELCKKIDDPKLEDKVTLVVSIADVITASAIGLPVPATLIAAIVVRIGARKFCSCPE